MSKVKILALSDGERVNVTGDEGKYWLCGDRRFRKLSRYILSVEDVEIQDVVSEMEEEAVPVKKTSRKKKKPTEGESTEGE